MEEIPSSEADSRCSGHHIDPYIKPKDLLLCSQSPPVTPTLSQVNTALYSIRPRHTFYAPFYEY
jgi:hypothetical protein